MIRRILFTTAAATALLAAAPALAAENAPSKQPCSCCSDSSAQETQRNERGGDRDWQELEAARQHVL